MSCPPSAAVRTSNVLSDAVAQHGHRDARRLRREFHRAETADRAAVDGQQQVALAQQLRGRRARRRRGPRSTPGDARRQRPRTAAPTPRAGRACAPARSAPPRTRPRANRAAAPPCTAATASATSSTGRPRLTCDTSRPASTAKLDHSARTRPSLPTITPSKSEGPFTSLATSRFASRNCSVRDSGKLTSSTEATVVAIERTRESPFMPTTTTDSPGTSSRGSSVAERIGVPSSSFGSNETIATLCSGCTYSTRPGTSTDPANVRRTSPTATGTVLRSTATSPRAASTTRPVPW